MTARLSNTGAGPTAPSHTTQHLCTGQRPIDFDPWVLPPPPPPEVMANMQVQWRPKSAGKWHPFQWEAILHCPTAEGHRGQFIICHGPLWAKFNAEYRFRRSLGVHTGCSSRLRPHGFPLGW